MTEIISTSTALSDLNRIAEYISLDSSFYARQFVQKVFSTTEKLETHPEIGKIVPDPAFNYS
ncbi:type II toxin-antitoxin system RelE/ParE family toxin [Segetibacter aerophilus]|uniref:Plasmid stabilization protein n=1 Tax=Segetibacter aerophilus TaxID=670293 RepID=A0A512BHM6_9BACT|nr:type II toxin-antitoxin system RelE/ParE family toxin [Segetibacter aerophilus]GEO11486.1 hypothetical protein SAE01_39820 [Segetibacter aerophilus]